MTDTPTQVSGISFEEFLRRYDGEHAEWVDGTAIVMSPASDRHQDVARFLTALLSYYVEAKDLGVLRPAPFLMRIDPDGAGREPDLLFVAREHRDRLTQSHLDGPADLIVEIVSPESRARDHGEKFDEYEAGAVREYWLIDPIREQAAFHRLDEDGIYRLADTHGSVFRSEVLDGLWLDTAWLWREPLPRLLDILREWRLI